MGFQPVRISLAALSSFERRMHGLEAHATARDFNQFIKSTGWNPMLRQKHGLEAHATR